MFGTKKRSLKTTLILYSVLLTIFISVLFGISSYTASKNALQVQAEKLVSSTVEQIMERTDMFLKNIHYSAITMAFDKDMRKILADNNLFDILKYLENFKTFNSLNTYVHEIAIYNLEQSLIINSDGANQIIQADDPNYIIIEDVFLKNKHIDAPFIWTRPRKVILHKGSATMGDILVFMLPVIALNGKTVSGVLVFSILEDSLASIYTDTELDDFGLFYIENEKKEIVSTGNKDYIGFKNSLVIDENENLITSTTSEYSNWTFTSVIPTDLLMKENIESMRKVFLLIAIVLVSIFIFISITFNRIFFRPVKSLMDSIRQSVQKQGELNIQIDRMDEIGFVFRSFQEILKENTQLLSENYEFKIASKNMQLEMLQAQINPHFLYNSLDTAINMIDLHEEELSKQIITSLINLFRTNLGKINEIVTVEKMMSNINSYIAIQKIRFHGRINFDMEIDSQIARCKLANLLLQPLIENSIIHGLEKKRGIVSILLTGKRIGNTIVFEVSDNGRGIAQEQLLKIRSIIENKEEEPNNFYALQNVNKRIKLLYGEEYGLIIESEEKKWTKATITLPYSDNEVSVED